MSQKHLPRRSLFESLFALPIGLAAKSPLVLPSSSVAKVAAGADRFNNVIKLPGGDLVYVKVAIGASLQIPCQVDVKFRNRRSRSKCPPRSVRRRFAACV